MTPSQDPQLDAFEVDVRGLLDRNVANLYSHLVTRPTGRAVRLAIESQLGELGSPALSLVDLSSVAILDYSCADEVVARLLLGRRNAGPGDAAAREVFYVFQGLREHHREPILEVLERHRLAAVARGDGRSSFEIIGVRTPEEEAVWMRVEEEGRVPADALPELLPGPSGREVAGALAERGLLFRHPDRGDLHALSTLVRERG
jgi:hypothetical protein